MTYQLVLFGENIPDCNHFANIPVSGYFMMCETSFRPLAVISSFPGAFLLFKYNSSFIFQYPNHKKRKSAIFIRNFTYFFENIFAYVNKIIIERNNNDLSCFLFSICIFLDLIVIWYYKGGSTCLQIEHGWFQYVG